MMENETACCASRPAPQESAKFSLGRHLRKMATGFLSLLKGMGLTGSYIIDPGKIITQQYPENRATLKMFPRFRGRLIMPHDEQGEHKCTACGICERACPNGSIAVLATRNLAGRKVLGQYVYRFSQCTLCNLCVEACPFGAISMGQEYEMAFNDRQTMIMVLNQKEGRG